jgi:hypothetical protein
LIVIVEAVRSRRPPGRSSGTGIAPAARAQSASSLAAQMKAFSDRPSIECVAKTTLQ